MTNPDMGEAFDRYFKSLEQQRREVDKLAKEKRDFIASYPDFKVGVKVTIKEGECKAWYSGYGLNPVYDNFLPGMVGTIGAIAVAKISAPHVRPHGWCDYYLCIDYTDSNGFEVRCNAEYINVEIVNDI